MIRHSVLIFIVLPIVALILLNRVAWAECREYTAEQQWLIESAMHIGAEKDWSYTLAAMVEVESFWGDVVRRENPDDAPGGSWGVMQMRVTTALWLLSMPDTPENRDAVIHRLVTDDIWAIELGYRYYLQHTWRGWRGAIRRYNGGGWRAERHVERVTETVFRMQRCL